MVALVLVLIPLLVVWVGRLAPLRVRCASGLPARDDPSAERPSGPHIPCLSPSADRRRARHRTVAN